MGENTVSFKVVLTYDNSASEVRRFGLERDVSTSLEYLKGKLATLFPAQLKGRNVQIFWVDSDGDEVTIGSDEELVIALTEMAGPVYKLSVRVGGKLSAGSEAKPSNTSGEVHAGVRCDGCDSGVAGFRYKCVTCPDYDLCGKCETNGVHREHNMMRMASPKAVWPRHYLSHLNKMQGRLASKRQAGAKSDENPAPDFHGWGGWNRGSTRGRCGWGQRPPQVLDSMMRGWSGEDQNLALHREMLQKQRDSFKKMADTMKTDSQQQQPPVKSPVEMGQDFLRTIGGMVASSLDPFGIDVHVDVEGPNGESTCLKPEKQGNLSGCGPSKPSKQESGPSEEAKTIETGASGASGSQEEAKTLETGASGTQEETKTLVTGASGTQEEAKTPKVENSGPSEEAKIQASGAEPGSSEEGKTQADGSDIDEEEWDVCSKSNSPSPSKRKNEPVVVEIPVEVEKSESGSGLYPKLPEEARKTQPEAVNEQTDGAAAIPVAVHTNPKIQVALQAMMNMGFTDEGGWLTQLLENKQGDIGKVLDVLQPVKRN